MNKITVLRSTKTKADKGYTIVELAYKTEDGKTKGMKIFGFGEQKANADVAGEAKPGDVLEAQFRQNQKGFWEFGSLKSTGEQAAEKPVSPTTGSSTSRGSWETPEERSAKDVRISRLSALSTAVAFFEAAKTKPTEQDVVRVAKVFEDFVFGREGKQQPQAKGDVE